MHPVWDHEIKASEKTLSEQERAEALYDRARNEFAIDEWHRIGMELDL